MSGMFGNLVMCLNGVSSNADSVARFILNLARSGTDETTWIERYVDLTADCVAALSFASGKPVISEAQLAARKLQIAARKAGKPVGKDYTEFSFMKYGGNALSYTEAMVPAAAIPAMKAKEAAIQSGAWDVPIDNSEPA